MTYVTLDDALFVAQSVANRSEGESHSLNNDGSGCLYTYPDGAHCLVGAIGEGLGLPLPTVDDSVNGASVSELNEWLQINHGIEIDPQAENFLSEAQRLADSGLYWPQAVQSALV